MIHGWQLSKHEIPSVRLVLSGGNDAASRDTIVTCNLAIKADRGNLVHGGHHHFYHPCTAHEQTNERERASKQASKQANLSLIRSRGELRRRRCISYLMRASLALAN